MSITIIEYISGYIPRFYISAGNYCNISVFTRKINEK